MMEGVCAVGSNISRQMMFLPLQQSASSVVKPLSSLRSPSASVSQLCLTPSSADQQRLLAQAWFAAVSTTSQDQHCELMHPSPRPFAIEGVLADLDLHPPLGCGLTITPEMQAIGAADQALKVTRCGEFTTPTGRKMLEQPLGIAVALSDQ